MSLRVNDLAPNFTATTTAGIIDGHALGGLVLTSERFYSGVHD
jgi:hypothetical protein